MVNLDRCNGHCNTLNDPYDRLCISNKTKYANLCVFNVTGRISKSKTLTKYILCKCKCKFDDKKSNSNQKWKKDKCQCECTCDQIIEVTKTTSSKTILANFSKKCNL